MQEEDYTFVTLDSDDAILTDAVIVDVDGENDLSDVVMIDESIDVSDFITLSDDTIMLSDADMLDTYSTDIDGSDISFILTTEQWTSRSLWIRMKNYHMFMLDGSIYILGQDIYQKNKFTVYNPIWDN